MALIDFTSKGLYCSAGDFYIDPWASVDKAVITHAHSDHARYGSRRYLAHHFSIPLLRHRLGENEFQGVEWNESIYINGVRISLHPAGHMIGSSQVRVEYGDEVWVVSGDYKTEDDNISGSFEPVRCDTFISESTFGLPIYNWRKQEQVYHQIQQWVLKNMDEGRTSILLAYSLGKAQRLLQCVGEITNRIYAHGAIYNSQEVLKNAGWNFPDVKRVTYDVSKEDLKGSVVLAPPGAANSPWIKRFGTYAVGMCSGWMQVRGNVRRRNVDAGFILSDHADWDGLLSAIKATGAARVFVTHGFQAAFSRYLNEIGIESAEVKTEYGDEREELEEATSNET